MVRKTLVVIATTLAAISLSALLPPKVLAGEEQGAQAPPEVIQAMKDAEGAEEKEAKRFREFDKVVKDMTPIEGLFTLYRYDPKDRDKDREKLLCKIPSNLLNQDLLFATSISRGGFFTGWMWTDHLVRWEIVGDYVKLVTPDIDYIHKSDKPVTDAVKRTYNDRYLASAKIVTMTSGGDPVIDLGTLLKSNLADVSFMGGSVRAPLSKWNEIKNFPDNVLIDVDLALAHRQGGGNVVGVSYAFRRLPDLGSYTPRVADDRLGYFLTARVDWSKKATERDTFERYVQRWKLEKRDPTLELSPPKKPITFIIEKTVPIQWRRWVRQGILEWNKAFEQVGFVDAIVVQQQTSDNDFADYDPEDARYNFFRWIVSGSAFAMGPSRVDPRTGQILDADIIMDDSFIRAFMQDFDLFSPSTVARMKGEGFRAWKDANPEFARTVLPPMLRGPVDPQQALVDIAHRKLAANGHRVCTYATGFQQQMALVYNALIATSTGKKVPERFIGEAIREVVAHEVGHTLGLRHNFKASSWLSLEEIRNRRDNSDEPTCGSVMDYNPLMFFKGDDAESVRHFVTPAIGPYDHWVIQYGYGAPGEGQSDDEFLKAVASRCAEPGLAYATDEDTMWVYSSDPKSNRFDMGENPADWVRSRFELCDELMTNITDWAINEGESRYHVRRAFNTILFEKARNFEYLGRMIGGQYFHRDHKGDPGQRPAFVLVDSSAQRDAFDLMGKTLFTEEFFKIDADLLNELAPSRWSHFRSRPGRRMDFPIHDQIAMLQWWTLFDITSPQVLQRIYDAELKTTDSNRLTAAEYIRTVRDQIWRHLDQPPNGSFTDASPYIGSLARGLQREYLNIVVSITRMSPGSLMSADLSGMVRFGLRQLSGKIGRVIEQAQLPNGDSKIDFASLAHLSESKSRIDRVLESRFTGR